MDLCFVSAQNKRHPLKDKPTVYSMGSNVCVCVSFSQCMYVCVCVSGVCADLHISMQLQSHVSALKRLNE